ncbi:ABC transporter substrate-binding protein [Ramlibacter sp. WS9]|uniref:ABC transporter substrate-binding protein n=1 Tax=Ramlibacter sp. WS9 TaxID=1882741 RepID=UPI001141D4F1|nr:ABC transporter substrate-binding protein [Ramlibacter sp. WS9]ROZ79814.1 ABC transporter substrate-binding protein [Ramlibacter sp. WS9]
MLIRSILTVCLAALLSACTTTRPALAPEGKPLRVVAFPGGSNWPLWVAMDKGFFAAEKLKVSITPTPDSTFQMKGLINGDFDVAITAMDNVIAYREGQGAAGVIGPDLVAVMGLDPGWLRVVADPQIRSYAALRGKVVAVDALTTGYAFALLEMLERNGLVLGRDYEVAPAGGAMQRYESLLQRKYAASLLLAPFDLLAQQQGFNVLGKADEVLGPYQGAVAAVRQGWGRSNASQLTGFIRSGVRAIDWLQDPANKEEAQRIYLSRMPPGTPPQAAATAYRAILVDAKGYQRGAQIDLRGVETVIRLRAKHGRSGAALREATHYYDPSFRNAAMPDRQGNP